MDTREGSRLCAMCDTGLLGGTAYLVDGIWRKARREPARFLICESCYQRGRPDPDTGLTRAVSTRQTQSIEWRGLAGRGAALPPQACAAGCGMLVVRGAEALMRGVTCSRACRTSLTRTRNGGRGSGLPCGACGEPVTAGRADSAYCNAACRQKAYRRRQSRRPSAVQELTAAMDPFVASAACLDISQTLYRALYRVQATHLRGHDPGDALAALASVDPERVKIPDTEDGLRLRAALRGIQAARNLHPHP